MEKEVWKDIRDYENLYQISNLGRIKSLNRTIQSGSRLVNLKERIRKTVTRKDGYVSICLSKNGKQKNIKLHRLMAINYLMFPIPKGLEVCHIDGDKLNNNIENLKIKTTMSNSTERIKHRSQTKGIKTKIKNFWPIDDCIYRLQVLDYEVNKENQNLQVIFKNIIRLSIPIPENELISKSIIKDLTKISRMNWENI